MISFKQHDYFCRCYGCRLIDYKLKTWQVFALALTVFGVGYYFFGVFNKTMKSDHNNSFAIDFNTDESLSHLIPGDTVLFMPEAFQKLILSFITTGKIDASGAFTSETAKTEFESCLARFKNQIGMIKNVKFPEKPKTPDYVENFRKLKNPTRVVKSSSAIIGKSRQLDNNLTLAYQRAELEKCRKDFNYFCEQHLKLPLLPFAKTLLERNENQFEKHR